MQKEFFIPPGGNIGAGSQTSAGRTALMGVGTPRQLRPSGNGTRRRRRKPRAEMRSPKRKTRGKKMARLVKGSRAAKAYMAKIRRKRR